MDTKRSQAIESLEIYDSSLMCQECKDQIEEDAKPDKLISLPLYSCRIAGIDLYVLAALMSSIR